MNRATLDREGKASPPQIEGDETRGTPLQQRQCVIQRELQPNQESNDAYHDISDSSIATSTTTTSTGKKRRRNSNDNCYDVDGNLPASKRSRVKQESNQSISLLSDDDEPTSFAFTSSSTTYSQTMAQNEFNRRHPIMIDDDSDSVSDSEDDIDIFNRKQRQQRETQGRQQAHQHEPITPDFPSSPDTNSNPNRHQFNSPSPHIPISPMQHDFSFDDAISVASNSPSLSIAEGFEQLTIHLSDDPETQQKQILDAWKRDVSPKDLTMRGLSTVRNLTMPRRECIALIKLIRENFNHVVFPSIRYKDRLISLIIGILEIMNLNERRNDASGPILDEWNNTRKPQVLLVASRRHMAIEARKMLLQIGRFYELHCQALIGGMPSYQCIRRLQGGLDIITGTPGKLMDMTMRNALNKTKLSNLIAFVMDGADDIARSQSMKDQMKYIVNEFPDRRIRVIWLESVRTSKSKCDASDFIHNMPASANSGNVGGDEKEQILLHENHEDGEALRKMQHIEKYVENSDKFTAMIDILRYYKGDRVVVFCNRKSTLRRVYGDYLRCGYREKEHDNRAALIIHGELRNEERRAAINGFRDNPRAILFATDILHNVSFQCNIVINLDLPEWDAESTYAQRAGVMMSEQPHVFNVVLGMKKRERAQHQQPSFDEQVMMFIEKSLNFRHISYHSFSKHRRHHRGFRDQGILVDYDDWQSSIASNRSGSRSRSARGD